MPHDRDGFTAPAPVPEQPDHAALTPPTDVCARPGRPLATRPAPVRTGADAMTWAFADGVHPSLGGHKVISNFMAQQLKTAGWI